MVTTILYRPVSNPRKWIVDESKWVEHLAFKKGFPPKANQRKGKETSRSGVGMGGYYQPV